MSRKSDLIGLCFLALCLMSARIALCQKPELLPGFGSTVRSDHCWHGNLFFNASDLSVLVWDLNAGKLHQKFDGHRSEVLCVAYDPATKSVLSGSGTTKTPDLRHDFSARLWELETGYEIRHVEAGTYLVTDVAFLPGGKMLTVHHYGMAHVWTMETGQHYFNIESLNGDFRERNGSIEKRLAKLDGDTRILVLEPHKEWDHYVPNTVGLLSIRRLGFVETIQADVDKRQKFIDAAINPDGNTFATLSEDGLIQLWCDEPSEGPEIMRVDPSENPRLSITYSPDGTRIFVNEENALLILNPANLEVVKKIESEMIGPDWIFSNDGKRGVNGKQLWDLENGNVILEDLKDTAAGFSPDGKQLLVLNQVIPLRLIDTSTGLITREFRIDAVPK